MEHSANATELPTASDLPAKSDLPDPLVTFDGDQVKTSAEWHDRRRPELKRLFEHYVYGTTPGRVSVSAEDHRSTTVFGGQATLTEFTVRFADLPPDAPSLDMALFTPTDCEAVPVFLGLNHNGNHSTVADDAVTVTDSGRRFGADEVGARDYFWCVEHILERGYGFATFHQADVDPDRDDFTDGIHPYYPDMPGSSTAHWGTLAAWAWGLRQAVTALQTRDDIREDGIALIGHSRRGKAVLLAGAVDERVDLVVPHQSGTGGCAPSRDNDQETIAEINETFPHWFNDIFPAFSGRSDRLPIDQHLLISLVAPRPIFDTEGVRDYWANPGRAYDAVKAAAPVYDLLDATGMVHNGLLHETDEITDQTAGDLLQYRRESGHTLNRGYWGAILDFADIHLR